MDVKDIKKLLEAAADADVNELSLETGDYKLSVKRGGEVVFDAPRQLQPQAPAPQPQASAQPAPQQAPAEPVPEQAESAAAQSHHAEVTAPIVGTFYSSSAPDAPPFVKIGDKVEAGTVLCIIEAMKLMNEIEAETGGTVADILVKNEEPVEYGQVLFRIDPG